MLKIRLRRMGNRNRPFYRVVVSDSRKVPTSSAIEEVGYYDPKNKDGGSQIDSERVRYWVGKGAQMTPTVKRLLRRQEETAA
jgi:small subunit ribosomal protein S16